MQPASSGPPEMPVMLRSDARLLLRWGLTLLLVSVSVAAESMKNSISMGRLPSRSCGHQSYARVSGGVLHIEELPSPFAASARIM